jgi:dTMP kinase
LREAYRQVATADPGRCAAIDATEPKPMVAERIWKIVTERLGSARVSSLPAGAAS